MAATPSGSTAPLSVGEVHHLWRRAGFGIGAAGAVAFAGQPRAAVVDAVLARSPAPSDITPPVLRDPSGSNWEQWVAGTQAWLDTMATSSAPIVEKLALFWHGHFVSGNDKIYDMPAMWEQVDLFRRTGTGSLRTLTHAVSLTPAMLFYLDNWRNQAEAPNENFARELLELFLLGAGTYTEDDVVAAARAWTGHTVDPASRRYLFRSDWHDAGPKTFLGTTAAFDGPGIIDAVFDHPTLRTVCAERIVRKLWTFFAHPGAPAGVVADLARVLLGSDWNIGATIRALFLRDEFFDPAARNGLVRSPVEWCVAVARASRSTAAEIHPEWHLPAMGQTLFAPPSVAGWGANRYWISTTAASARADHAAYAALKSATLHDALADTPELPIDVAVTRAFEAFEVDRVSVGTRAQVSTWLASQRSIPFTGYLESQHLFTLVALTPEVQLA